VTRTWRYRLYPRPAQAAEVEHAAQQAHIEIERMYGQQATAFTFSLPFCRGLA